MGRLGRLGVVGALPFKADWRVAAALTIVRSGIADRKRDGARASRGGDADAASIVALPAGKDLACWACRSEGMAGVSLATREAHWIPRSRLLVFKLVGIGRRLVGGVGCSAAAPRAGPAAASPWSEVVVAAAALRARLRLGAFWTRVVFFSFATYRSRDSAHHHQSTPPNPINLHRAPPGYRLAPRWVPPWLQRS